MSETPIKNEWVSGGKVGSAMSYLVSNDSYNLLISIWERLGATFASQTTTDGKIEVAKLLKSAHEIPQDFNVIHKLNLEGKYEAASALAKLTEMKISIFHLQLMIRNLW